MTEKVKRPDAPTKAPAADEPVQEGNARRSEAGRMNHADGEQHLSADKGTAPPPAPAQITPYGYTAKELKALVDRMFEGKDANKRKEASKGWISWGIRCNRYYARDQMGQGHIEALDIVADFERDAPKLFPEAGAAAVGEAPDRAAWCSEILAAYLTGSPMGKKALSEDAGRAGSKTDSSAELTDSFIGKLTDLETALKKHFAGDAAIAIQELTVRREIFVSFKKNHNKSQVESGVAISEESVVKDKINNKVTSCNLYASHVLREAFREANTKLSKDGQGVAVKATSVMGWDMKKKVTTKGRKQQHFGFYDTLGRSAKEAGAWNEPGSGRPKPGDQFVVETKGGSISHIAFFKFAEPVANGQEGQEIWHSFDGGQLAGKVMKGKVNGAMREAYDGALNNVRRLYSANSIGKGTNEHSLTYPSAEQLAALRGKTGGADGEKAAPVNQDLKGVKYLAGWIDTGALIAHQEKKEDKDEGA